MDSIRIQMMEDFHIIVNGRVVDQALNKSRKGVSLIQYLIINRGTSVPNYRLLSTIWNEEDSSNPENALKTLVSRLRSLLNSIYPSLGKCIVADRGAYHWEKLPCMTVDLEEVQDTLEQLSHCKNEPEKAEQLYETLLGLYAGDLLLHCEQNEWAVVHATSLHTQFMSAVYSYIELLKSQERFQEIVGVCRKALEVDNFDDRLHIELMSALIKNDRTNEALAQYKHVTQLNYRYLGIQPSNDMQAFYKQIVNAGKSLDFNLESISSELRASATTRGAFVCGYEVFKEIYSLQMRNLERTGRTMFLGLIMISNIDDTVIDPIRQDNIMNSLMEILRYNLRKGDTITQFAPNMIALLLPTLNYSTGNLIMERIKRVFYEKYPNSNIAFNYRIGLLSGDESANENKNN